MTGSKKPQSLLSRISSVFTGRDYSKSKKVQTKKGKSRKIVQKVMDSLTNNAYSKNHKNTIGYQTHKVSHVKAQKQSMQPRSNEKYRDYVKRTFHPAQAFLQASGSTVGNGAASTMRYIGKMWSDAKGRKSKTSSRYADAKSHFTWFWDKKEPKVEDKPVVTETAPVVDEMPMKKPRKTVSKKGKRSSKKRSSKKRSSTKSKQGSSKRKRSTSYASKKDKHHSKGLVKGSYDLARDTGVGMGRLGTNIFSNTTKRSDPYKISSKKKHKKSMWSQAYASKSKPKGSRKTKQGKKPVCVCDVKQAMTPHGGTVTTEACVCGIPK